MRESQKRRYADVGLVDKVVALDADWRSGEFWGMHMNTFGHADWTRMCLETHFSSPADMQLLVFVLHQLLVYVYIAARYDLDQVKKEFNALVKQIGELRKVGDHDPWV